MTIDKEYTKRCKEYATKRNKAVERLRLATAYADDGACNTAIDIAKQAIEALEAAVKAKAGLMK